MNQYHRLKDINRLSSLFQYIHWLPATDYLDVLSKKVGEDIVQIADAPSLVLLGKLWFFLEKSYETSGLIGKGYHCFEHSLEMGYLTLKLSLEKSGYLDASDAVENFVAALLHDFDPRESLTPPSVQRTIALLQNHEGLKSFVRRLNLNPHHIRLLIERTEYPFTPEKDLLWQSQLRFLFSDSEKRAKFIERAERFAFVDKAATYLVLNPEQAEIRVEGLAVELRQPKEYIFANTPLFLEREDIGSLTDWLPKEFKERWLAVKRHFEAISRRELTRSEV